MKSLSEWLTKLFGCAKNEESVGSPSLVEAGQPSKSPDVFSSELELRTYWAPSLGFMKDKYSERSLEDVRGIVFHSTGAGLYKRWRRDNPKPPAFPVHKSYHNMTWKDWQARKGSEATPFDTAVRVYASMMYPGPHFVVCGHTGRIARTCPLALAAWHVGRKGRKAYEKGVDNKVWKDYWWHLRRPTPLALLGGPEWDEVNKITVGIEISPPRHGARSPLTQNAYKSLSGLTRAIVRGQFGELPNFIPREETLVTHWDVHPNSRSFDNGNPWDLPFTQWREEQVRKHIIMPAVRAYEDKNND